MNQDASDASVTHPVAGSFRDPWGVVYRARGTILRQIQPAGMPAYSQLMGSGLYDALVERRALVPHNEVSLARALTTSAARVLEPEPMPWISWPYEWPFSALKAAALLTLDIADLAIDHGMTLRDASAYNVQFRGTQPVFIDTLSFGPYDEGAPWVAYGQFCRHFLAPLALMSQIDVRLGSLLRTHIDGVPLDLASSLLPLRTWLSPALAMHLHLHSRSGGGKTDSTNQIDEAKRASTVRVSKVQLKGMLDSLRGAIRKMDYTPAGTVWGDYYDDTNYSDDAMAEKAQLVRSLIEPLAPAMLWDIGGNTGRFAELGCDLGAYAIAFDMDPAAVERGFRGSQQAKRSDLAHFVMDLTNPSPTLGWAQEERPGFSERGRPDVVMALALIHHIAIGNNVPLPRFVDMLAALSDQALVEFVPKSDSQVQRMLASREDIFADYDEDGFEAAAKRRFSIIERRPIPGTARTLFLLGRLP